MSQIQIKAFALEYAPAEPAEPFAFYLIRPDGDSPFDLFVTDADGMLSPLGNESFVIATMAASMAEKQPLNEANLSAIAALDTTEFGRSLLEGEDAEAIRTLIEVDTADFLPFSYLDTDATFAANSDSKIASQKATKTALDLKAALASPAFTGNPTVPTQTLGNNTTRIANTAFVQAAIAALVASSPAALDTLNELATALGNDANFAATMTTALAGKQPLDTELTALAGVTSAANSFPYFTGSGTASLLVIVSAIRSLLASADLATFRTNAGLGTGDNPQFSGVEIGHATDTLLARVAAGIASIAGETINGYAATATAAGTTTLTITAAKVQIFTGSSTQTVKLPTTGVVIGQPYVIVNTSSGLVTVQSSGANEICKLGLNQAVECVALQATPTSAAHWMFKKTNINANTNGKRVVTVTQSATPAINTNNGDIFEITGLAQAITSLTTNLTGNPVSGDMFELRITDNGTARAITAGASFGSSTVALPTTTVISTMLRILFQYDTVWRCVGVA